MKPSESIRKIWEEMKELKKMREAVILKRAFSRIRRDYLEEKYEDIDILFGNEETLLKAIVYYLDTKK